MSTDPATISSTSDLIWEVTDVAPWSESGKYLRGCHLDTPRLGDQGDTYMVEISGWIVGRTSQARSVRIVHEGSPLREVPASIARPDIASRFDGVSPDAVRGFSTSISLIALGTECEVSVMALLEDGQVIPIGTIRIRHRPISTGYESALQPLMLTGLGRSGGTWMMSMLRAHPQIVVFPEFPHEERMASYWLHMLTVLSAPANRFQSADTSFQTDPSWVGHNPFHDAKALRGSAVGLWLGRTYVERLAEFCQRSIDDCYLTVAREDGKDVESLAGGQSRAREAPVYFAEKMGPTRIANVAWELYPGTKEVFLVRDFRDMACSVFAFDRKRGFFGFGRTEDQSEENYLGSLRLQVNDLSLSWKKRKDHAHLVRYEDLVFQPRETMTGVLAYLGLDSSGPAVDRIVQEGSLEAHGGEAGSSVAGHRTTRDPVASVGRWREDLDDVLRARYEEAFGEFLAEFGYSEAGYDDARVEA
jgi:Sulfotransferase family